MISSSFAFLPVRLYVFDGRWWKPTGRWSWLCKVRFVDTVWGERFHVDQRVRILLDAEGET